MKILAWNCCGLALAPTILVLRALIRYYRLDLLFLSETKVSSSLFWFLLHGLGFVDMLKVPPVGSRGGIFLTWKDGVDLELVKLDSHSICCLVFSEPLSTPWMFSFVYAPHLISEMFDFWTRMSELGNSFGGAWLLMGDFNYVLSFFEKSGGRSFGSPSHLEFLDFVHSNALVDLGFVGNRYTWSNHRCGRDNIRERLGRGDLPKPFRFEAFWTRDLSSFSVVTNAWLDSVVGSPALSLSRKWKKTKSALKFWNKHHFRHIQTRIKSLMADIGVIQSAFHSVVNAARDSGDFCFKGPYMSNF
ncbi:uncharacterized protein LOC133863383 [Alnus glutinosa]|uniref:uncharacterized protein LOC133863383 n=1 Tax=Alnus glutinosa TaxID=3517 RepID=UPI002D79CB21|nr:uncharacterized protein LOC133863383 [Alnus glutinosa]